MTYDNNTKTRYFKYFAYRSYGVNICKNKQKNVNTTVNKKNSNEEQLTASPLP